MENLKNQSSGKSPKIKRLQNSDWQLWVLLLPTLVYFLIFNYLPMYGIQIAFRDYKAVFGITGSQWVGLKNFTDFFKSYYFGRLVANTFLLNIYGLLWSFPIPIIMAILINQIERPLFKRFIQTTIYVPHFISTVVMVGMLYLFFSPTSGIINKFVEMLGGKAIYFMAEPGWFRTLFIGTDIWQHSGWSTIIFIATLTGIDPELYEAATVDGATKTQKIWHIDVPHLMPVAIMMLILSCGRVLVSNTDKALLMKNAANSSMADIIGIYVYEMGLGKAQFSYTAAIGLFTNVINFIIIMLVNGFSKKVSETSLF
jgi:putative aldouronate transport system permease protein